jgi:hypothetical protein
VANTRRVRGTIAEETVKTGKCKLCLQEGIELRVSHGVPVGVYRILRDDNAKNPNPWLVSEQGAVQTSKQLTAPLLCYDCEQRLSTDGENWVLANCLKKDGRFRLASILSSRTADVSSPANPTRVYWATNIPEIDRSALAYFAASIFWRGSIYGWNHDSVWSKNSSAFMEIIGRQRFSDLVVFPPTHRFFRIRERVESRFHKRHKDGQ